MSPASKSSSDNASDNHGYLETENYASTELDIPNPGMDVDADDDASSVVESLVGSTTSLSSSNTAPLPRLLRPRNGLPYDQESRNVMCQALLDKCHASGRVYADDVTDIAEQLGVNKATVYRIWHCILASLADTGRVDPNYKMKGTQYRISDINRDRAYAALQTISRQRQERKHAAGNNSHAVDVVAPKPLTRRCKRKRQATEATVAAAMPLTRTVTADESGRRTIDHATTSFPNNDGVSQTTATKKFVLDLDADELQKLQQDPYAYLGVDAEMVQVHIELVDETSPPAPEQLSEASTTRGTNGKDATFSVAETASPPSTSAPTEFGSAAFEPLRNSATGTATTRPLLQNVEAAPTTGDHVNLLNESKDESSSISSGKTASGPKDATIILPLARHGVNLTAESREIVCNALLDRCLPDGTLKKGARHDVRRLLDLNMATVDRIWSLILASVAAKGVVDMTFDTNKSKLPFCISRATLALQRVLAQRNNGK